ncbi:MULTISPECIES: hypothetical protein [Cupriavidus]|uniref:hypothetical protein n=1 Tax=Cupriavidus sp. 30B13 TaxID=3384241 RepID=UPI003B91CB30
MTKVFDLAAYRKRQAGAAADDGQAGSADDKMVVRLQADGSYRVTITGAYADTPSLAVEALADIIQTLAIAARVTRAI